MFSCSYTPIKLREMILMEAEILLANINQLHTTKMGIDRIQRNLGLDTDDVVFWCAQKITDPQCVITRKGKNWYAAMDGCVITINAHSYTLITAHQTLKVRDRL